MAGAWDLKLFYAINGWPDWLNPLMQFMSKGSDSWPVRIILFGILVYLVRRPETRVGGIVAGLGWIVANAITDLIKDGWPYPRPGNVIEDAIIRVGMSQSAGTASAHSANMAFVAVAFVLWFGWRWSAWIPVALLVGLSRVYVAAHYPSQVLLGWLVGGLTAAALSLGVQWELRRRGYQLVNGKVLRQIDTA